MTIQTEKVKQIFNEMSDEYDNLNDLYYSYTFSQIDKTLINYFQIDDTQSNKPLALDVGCGTGIQSLRLAKLGYKVIGIDISENLVNIAKQKLKNSGIDDAEFYLINAESIPFEDNFFDVVNCCGPTLPFIEKWQQTLSEISRVLKPNGKFLLEVEGKWNFDIFWEVFNSIFFNILGYDESLKETLKHFKNIRKGHHIDYSFKLESGETVSMPLRLYTASEIRKNLYANNFIIKKRFGLHSITNIFPSTILHNANPNKFVKICFKILSSIEKKINSIYPFRSFACSLLIYSQKIKWK
ncbi:MAG: class I SAM-dependent methyltransferase [Bacteroidales bacterium]|jgi:demethylmenaquinone methyltransferase/2-methoxy-6-polyprenyl-1,4-benzoquinol methylase|nr:class I SAM-dependent methyltransferase [Bacteroidales bacterium]